jgi:endoglycosylceramidase
MRRRATRGVRGKWGRLAITFIAAATGGLLTVPSTAGAAAGVTTATKAANATGAPAGYTPTPLAGAVPGPLTVENDRFVDADGRVVFLHGLFGVWKIPGGLPPDSTDPDGFTPADADTVASLGFDGFRLAWFWSDLEPTQGQYDTTYLAGYKALANELEQRGLFVLADSHQDMYSSVFNGDGFPTWASPASDTDPNPEAFPLNYFTAPTEEAFDDFWANDDSVQDAYDAAWKQVAAQFVGDPLLVGYDLLNEPFPGSDVGSCLGAKGCKSSDQSNIESAETRAAQAIATVDSRHISFYEPNILFNWGQPTGLVKPAATGTDRGLSFHNQCEERAVWEAGGGSTQPTPAQEASCLQQMEVPFKTAKKTAKKMGAVPFMTEVATITNDDPAGLECVFENADAHQTSWTYGLSWKSGELGSLDPAKAAVLARTYPVAVAGTPTHFGFDARTGIFHMKYTASGGPAPTVISVPTAIHYPDGYQVRVKGGGVVTSAAGAQQLTVTAPAGAKVSLQLTPIGSVTTAASSLPSCASLLDPSS